MGVVKMGETTTRLGCTVRTVPVTREDGHDTLLALAVDTETDRRHIGVLLGEADRQALVEMLGGRF